MEELLKGLEEAKQNVVEIERKIEEKKTETARWKPEERDEYWFINDFERVIMKDCWDNYSVDNWRYEIGNCFQSPEEAEFFAEKLKVIAELKGYKESKNRVWDRENFHYHIFYNYTTEKVEIGCSQTVRRNEIYFESKEKARQAIDAVGEDRIKKYYLGLEE